MRCTDLLSESQCQNLSDPAPKPVNAAKLKAPHCTELRTTRMAIGPCFATRAGSTLKINPIIDTAVRGKRRNGIEHLCGGPNVALFFMAWRGESFCDCMLAPI
jgi:hypothetical protein